MTTKTVPGDKLFKAFSDETRLRILSMLKSGKEICVCDIQDTLQTTQPKVSRHLSMLRQSGLVDTRRDGTWIYYTLSEPANPLHRNLLSCLDNCLGEFPVLRRDQARLGRKKKC